MSLRYRSCGEVHKDFHRLVCATLRYLTDLYGREAAEEVVVRTAKGVFRSMRESLAAGDFAELSEYWRLHLSREGGDFSIESLPDGLRLTVRDCPAQRRMVELGEAPDPVLCRATQIFNEALAEGSPFEASTIVSGEFSCVQEFRTRERVT